MKSINFFVSLSLALCCSVNLGTYAGSPANLQDLSRIHTRSVVEWICSSNEDCTTPETSCVDQRCQCRPNFVFNSALTTCLRVATAYGDTCEDSTQCTAYLLAGGICSKGVCSCVPGYHYLHGRCVKSAGLRENCRSDEECYANADHEALSCRESVCQCSDGFYQREYRTCRPEAKSEGAGCLIDLDCTYDKEAQCNKETGCFVPSKNQTAVKRTNPEIEKIGMKMVPLVRLEVSVGSDCKSNGDCDGLGAATCDPEGKCACTRGHFPNAKLTACVPELGEGCQENDVSSIKNAVCRGGKWSCKAATVPSRNNRLCRKATTAYNSSCQFDEQCFVFGPDAVCLAKKCRCNESSHYSEKNMFCWINRGIGESCKIDEDCHVAEFDSELACVDSTCGCPKGTHVNSAGKACISDVAELGSACTADVDCKSLENAVCREDACRCGEDYFELEGKCASGIGAQCESDSDCKIVNSTCVSNQCKCADGYASPSTELCLPVSSFGGECHYDVQCSATASGSLCALPEVPETTQAPEEPDIAVADSPSGVCTCDSGHHYKYGRCYRTRVLRETCESLGECYVDSRDDSVRCLKGICTCDWNMREINSTFCKNHGARSSGVSTLLSLGLLALKFIVFP